MATYLRCKKVIEKGSYDQTDLMEKLDAFLLNNRITVEQYNELMALINPS